MRCVLLLGMAILMVLGSTHRLDEIGKGRQESFIHERDGIMKGRERKRIKPSLQLGPVEREGKSLLARK